MHHNMAKSAFWQAHEQFPQLPEFEDFDGAVNAVTPPEPVEITNPNPKVRKSGAVAKAVLAQDPGFDGAKSSFFKQNK